MKKSVGFMYSEGHGFTYNHPGCTECVDCLEIFRSEAREEMVGEVVKILDRYCLDDIISEIKSRFKDKT